jgi:hypothetical protein
MISKLIEALRSVDPELNYRDLADLLWLASHIEIDPATVTPIYLANGGEKQQEAAQSGLEEKTKDLLSSENGHLSEGSASELDATNQETQQKEEKQQPRTTLGLPGDIETGKFQRSQLFRVPGVTSLPGKLKLAKALYPLQKRIDNQLVSEIDEQATANRIAETKVWLPVLQPVKDRWLDLELVVDQSVSMALWKPVVADVHRLLVQLGAFRNVRRWILTSDDSLQLYGGKNTEQATKHSWQELRDVSGQRLIIVVSDCMSRGWKSGEAFEWLGKWGRTNPVALLQMLPEYMWSASALGLGLGVEQDENPSVNLYLTGQKIANRNLRVVSSKASGEQSSRSKPKSKKNNAEFALPVINLEAFRIYDWTKMLSGKAGVHAKGYLLPIKTELWQASSTASSSNSEDATKFGSILEDPAKLIQEFRAKCTPVTRQLAVLLSEVPFNLPVIRLVQHTMLPESGSLHLAELYYSGLLRRVQTFTSGHKTDGDSVIYDFKPGVRQLLQKSLQFSKSKRVRKLLTQYLEKKAGIEQFQEFVAYLSSSTGDFNIVLQPEVLADITAKKLRSLGPKYTSTVETLEQNFTEKEKGVKSLDAPKPVEPNTSSISSSDEIKIQGQLAASVIDSTTSTSTENRYAICVGVNNYQPTAKVYPLIYAEKNAQDVYDLFLQRGFAPENCRLLLGEAATLSAINTTLREVLVNKAKRDDLIIFYFAGHCCRVSYEEDDESDSEVFLASQDFDANQIKEDRSHRLDKALGLNRLRVEYFERTPSNKLLFILDSCYSGDFAGSNYRGKDDIQADIKEAFDSKRAGRVALTSCSPNERAYESSELEQGIFTHHLLQALSGTTGAVEADGWLTAISLHGFISQAFEGSGKTSQKPNLYGNQQGRFQLIRYERFDINNISTNSYELFELIDLLLKCPTFSDNGRRYTLVGNLPSNIQNSVSLSNTAKEQVLNILKSYLMYYNSLDGFLEVVGFFEADSVPFHAVKKWVAQRNKPQKAGGVLPQPLSEVNQPASLFRVYVSRLEDTNEEWLLVSDLLQRLSARTLFRGRVGFEPSALHPAECDVVIILLWSRIGQPCTVNGQHYPSSTHYEILDAVEKGHPHIYVYHRSEVKMFKRHEKENMAQNDALDEFIESDMFGALVADKKIKFRQHQTVSDFREIFEADLEQLTLDLLIKQSARQTASGANFTSIPAPAPSIKPEIMTNIQLFKLTGLLLECPSLATAAGRAGVISLLPPHIRNILPATANARADVISLVQTCLRFPNGLELLLDIIRSFEKSSIPFTKVEEYVATLDPSQIYAFVATDTDTDRELRPLVLDYLRAFKNEYQKRDLASYVRLTTQPGSRGMAYDGASEEPDAYSAEMEQLRAFLDSQAARPAYSPVQPQPLATPDPQQPATDLEDFLLKNTRVMLLGAPGAGKSTSLRYLVRLLAQNWQNPTAPVFPPIAGAVVAEEWRNLIPLYVELNHWDSEIATLPDFLRHELRTRYNSPKLADKLDELLHANRVLLLLDALNEMPGFSSFTQLATGDRRVGAIAALSIQYPALPCLLSCRVRDFVHGPAWRDLHILPLNQAQVYEFALTAYRRYGKEGEQRAATLMGLLFDKASATGRKLREIAAQPFYLLKLLAYYDEKRELPSNPAESLKF